MKSSDANPAASHLKPDLVPRVVTRILRVREVCARTGLSRTPRIIDGSPDNASFFDRDFNHAVQIQVSVPRFSSFGTSGGVTLDVVTCQGAAVPISNDFSCAVLGADEAAPANRTSPR